MHVESKPQQGSRIGADADEGGVTKGDLSDETADDVPSAREANVEQAEDDEVKEVRMLPQGPSEPGDGRGL